MELTERFWSASLDELMNGYLFDESLESYVCLICGEMFEDGVIYPQGEQFFEARKFVKHHLEHTHGSMLSYLLSLDKRATGLTDLQKELIEAFASGMSDGDIVKQTGAGSTSTIRNHRFALKEKAKQAKLFLAIMEMLEQYASGAPRFIPIHRSATQVDERYNLTEEEYAALLSKYFPDGPEGRLTGFPRKEKRKLAILRHIASFFERKRRYTEKEVNQVLSRFYEEDYVTLRRYLIEYGFMGREDDGSAYWLKI
ncbi:DUF2087 domain-containing protein [Paenibacillus abyssi]|uniref:Transcriptional regulator n=1 Tax=Paenibacillus abyssi TaxID=1340531 RepID=A0A917G0Y6_9BACL|nr:DUF2087 domain-containing protein [Paenibacillus abyssi]GGG17466.1 transcriptional regulator [Paenibacillus abyssi]